MELGFNKSTFSISPIFIFTIVVISWKLEYRGTPFELKSLQAAGFCESCKKLNVLIKRKKNEKWEIYALSQAKTIGTLTP